jgi:hypothetical protein
MIESMKAKAMGIVAMNPDYFHRDFYEWLGENFEMYEYFHREAMRCVGNGIAHIGSKMIIENLRYRTILREIPGCGFKINNRVSPDLPRLFGKMEPAHASLFEFRKINSEGTIAI